MVIRFKHGKLTHSILQHRRTILGQTSYALALIVMTVVMAVSLVSFAIVFDNYILDHKVSFPTADMDHTFSDIKSGKIWNSIVTQFKQLS